jgi:hypothetical protein
MGTYPVLLENRLTPGAKIPDSTDLPNTIYTGCGEDLSLELCENTNDEILRSACGGSHSTNTLFLIKSILRFIR